MSKKEKTGYEEAIKGLMTQNVGIIESLLAMQIENIEDSGLDARSHALVRIAALVAVDAPPASYVWQVGVALDSGVTPDEIVGVLIALAPSIGMARVVAAAPEIALALGMELEGLDF